MIRSAEPGEDWRWCYPDDRLYMGDASATRPPRRDPAMEEPHPMIENVPPGPHGPLANVLAVRRGQG